MARGGGVGSVIKYKIKGGYRHKAVVQHYGRKYIEGGFLTVASARERAWEMKQELTAGTYETPGQKAKRLAREERAANAGAATVAEYAGEWVDELRTLQEQGQKSANTVRSYKSLINRHINPHLGSVRVSAVTREAVQDWHKRLASEKSPAVAVNAYRVLSALMSRAVDEGLINASPCKVKGATKAVANQREQHYFTHGEYTALYEALAACDMPAYAAIASLIYFTACRPSEARALRVGDIDLTRGRIRYGASLQRSETGATVEGPTKTKRVRYAPIPGPLADILGPLCAGRDSSEWVFTSPRDKNAPASDRHLNTRTRLALDSIGLKDAELYDLKHTCLTNLGRAGASLKELMDLPGHTQIETVLKYQLADFDRVASAVERMAERLEK